MKLHGYRCLAALSLVPAAAVPAMAATTVARCDSGVINSPTGCNIVFDGTSGNFGNPNVIASPFVDIYAFDIAGPGRLGLTLTSVASSGPTDIAFQLVRLNPPQGGGGNVVLAQGSTGAVEFYQLSQFATVAGEYRLRLEGTVASAPPTASYTGSISFAQTAAVPEPASWALMMLGFSTVGFALRRRQTYQKRIRFA